MARTKAISMLQAASTKADLAEIYGIVVDNVMKDTLSGVLKSQKYTGDPAAGSVEYKRFASSQAKAYGTARTANKGDALKVPPVTCNLNVHKEIVEECAKNDLDRLGAARIMARRAEDHIDTMTSELDIAFFAAAAAAATELTLTATEPIEQVEEAMVTLETVKNEFVKGTNRINHAVVCSPKFYSKIRNDLDSRPNANVDTAAEEFGMFHGGKVYSSINLPEGIDFIIMHKDSIGQPVSMDQYSDPEKIPLSNDYAVSLFYDYGTTAITPDLIFKKSADEGGD